MADLSAVPWNAFPTDAKPDDLVSADFRFYELTKSETASRLRIDNAFPGADEMRAAVFLCRNVLQPIRNAFGAFSPNSVYRCQELERKLKKRRNDWTSRSQHTSGQACDIGIPGVPTLELARWASRQIEFDQVICECYDPAEGVNSGWVHISLVPPGRGLNRAVSLSYVVDGVTGRYAYVKGLRQSA